MTAEGNTPRRPVVALVACGISLVLALVAVALWALATTSSSVAQAETRDKALQEGTSAVIAFNTLDHKNVEAGLKRWEQYSAGPLRDEIRKSHKDYATKIQQAKSSTTAKVLDSGLTELDQQAGKAKMIAVVQVTVTIDGQKPTTKQDRYQAELTREGDTWKLSNLGTVPVG